MKSTKYSRWFFSFLLLSITYGTIVAQPFSESRKITRVFKTEPGATLDISNKYGKIQVFTRESDSIRIEIGLSAKADNEGRLNKIMSSIDFDFTVDNNYVNVKTTFSSSFVNILSEIISLAEPLTIGDNDVNINYSVYVPVKTNIVIDNKYGDVFMNDISSDLKLILLNGDVKANNLSGKTDITLKFGNGFINSIDSGRIEVSYGSLSLKQTDYLNIDSKSSKITIEGCNDLKINSKRDKYTINEVNFFRGEISFTDLNINNLYHELNFKMNYGNLDIDFIPKTFSMINVSSQYTNLNFYFEKKSSFYADITYIDVKFNCPKDFSKLKEQVIDPDLKKLYRFGAIGKSTTDSRLNIYAEHSTISVFEK
ncbi:MAG: hypothetical protein NTW49_10625 [Bacteroidia bacterium]|nr:hypothetical protein [Bacteroidia bacterium]